jgi:hypothetical protein
MKLKIVKIVVLLALLAPLPRFINADAPTSVSSAGVSSEDEELEEAQTRSSKFKRINRLCVKALSVRCSLSVNGTFTVNGFNFSSPALIASAIAAAGLPSVTSTGPITTTSSLTIGGCVLTCVGGTLEVNGAPVSSGSSLGAAEFVRIIAQPGSTAPGTAFTIDTQVFNNIPAVIVPGAGAGGSVFTLNTAGVYVLDYEASFDLTTPGAAMGVYTGPNAGSLALDTNTVAGTGVATNWVHGRSFVIVGPNPVVVAISSVSSTPTVVTSGPAPEISIRLSILKVA